MIERRDFQIARIFVDDLASRLANRIQLTTDGLRVYLEAVEGAFGSEIGYAMLLKLYAASQEEVRCSPAECVGVERKIVMVNQDRDQISTSLAERQNLSMRMGMRRFTGVTNGFSKRVENHAYMVALYFVHYNFARVYRTLSVTPAMEAGVSDHVWSIEEIAALIPEPAYGPRGPYRRRNH